MATPFAEAEDAERMVGILEIEITADFLLQSFQTLVVEFQDIPAPGANQVIVVFARLRLLIEGSGSAKVQLVHQAAFLQ